MAETNKDDVPILTGKSNYYIWKVKMRASLRIRDLWKYVEDGDGAEGYKKRQDEVAQGRIDLAVGEHLIAHIEDAKSAKEAWEKLEKMCGGDGLVRRVQLMADLVNTRLDTCNGMADYVQRIISTVHELKRIKFEVSDDWAATFLLAGLPSSYSPMVMALQNSGKELSLDDIQVQLMQERADEPENKNSALVAQPQRDAVPGAQSQGRRGCFVCGKLGHFAAQCWSKGRKNNVQGGQGVQGNNDQHSLLTMALQCGSSSEWIIDSGASSHMSASLPLMTTSEKTAISVADGRQVEAIGGGTVDVMMSNGSRDVPCVLNNVLCVPDLTVNLLSVQKACQSGKEIRFKGDQCTILSGKAVIGHGVLRDGLYRLVTGSTVHAAVAQTSGSVWHRRLGHLNCGYMTRMASKIGKSAINDDCGTCAVAKMTRGPFKSSNSRSTKKLELVHSDVCEMDTVSTGGNRYFVTFLCDFSRKLWLFPIKKKSDVFEKFQQFQACAERESGEKIISVRSDNGGEYVNNQFAEYLRKNGIKQELTVPHNPEQNGAAERVNRTIIDKVRCMLTDSGLPKNVWAEAANTAVYIINRCPAEAIDFKIPEEVWTDRQVSVNHLRIFGSKVVAYIPKHKRQKLDNPGRDGVLVGYGEGQKGYRVLFGDKVCVTCNVRIFEGNFNKSEGSSNEQVNQIDDQQEAENIDSSGEEEAELDSGEEEGADTDESSFYESAETGEDLIASGSSGVRRSNRVPQPRREPNFVYGEELDDAIQREGDEVAYCVGRFTTPQQHVDAVYVATNIPVTYADAKQSRESSSWKEAMKAELKSLCDYGTWELVQRPKGVRVLKNRWVYQKKESTEKAPFKARLVVKGFMQDEHGLETFSPVVRYDTIRAVLSVASGLGMTMAKFDVKTAFLNGKLKETVYMEQPDGHNDGSGRVCRLIKSLYGLKQAPRCWGQEIERVLISFGFSVGESDRCLFVRGTGEDQIIILLYVDDGLVLSRKKELILSLLSDLERKFQMTSTWQVTNFLGMEIAQEGKKIAISQRRYIEEIVKRFRMEQATTVSIPIIQGWESVMSPDFKEKRLYQELVGSLRYVSVVSRPDICFALTRLSGGLEKPSEAHWRLGKQVIRYLKGTSDWKLVLGGDEVSSVSIYTDADYAGDVETRRSTSGVLGLLGSSTVVWTSRLQSVVALSTTEAELMAAVEGAKEGLWLKKVLVDLQIVSGPVLLCIDNQSALALLKDPTTNRRTKHVEVWMGFLRDIVRRQKVEYKFVGTDEQVADPLTKSLTTDRLREWRAQLSSQLEE